MCAGMIQFQLTACSMMSVFWCVFLGKNGPDGVS